MKLSQGDQMFLPGDGSPYGGSEDGDNPIVGLLGKRAAVPLRLSRNKLDIDRDGLEKYIDSISDPADREFADLLSSAMQLSIEQAVKYTARCSLGFADEASLAAEGELRPLVEGSSAVELAEAQGAAAARQREEGGSDEAGVVARQAFVARRDVLRVALTFRPQDGAEIAPLVAKMFGTAVLSDPSFRGGFATPGGPPPPNSAPGWIFYVLSPPRAAEGCSCDAAFGAVCRFEDVLRGAMEEGGGGSGGLVGLAGRLGGQPPQAGKPQASKQAAR